MPRRIAGPSVLEHMAATCSMCQVLWLLLLHIALKATVANSQTIRSFKVANQTSFVDAFTQIFPSVAAGAAGQRSAVAGTQGSIFFTGSQRVYRLPATGVVVNGALVRLDASQSPLGVTLLPPTTPNSRHFRLNGPNANLTAIDVTFRNAYIRASSGTVRGASIFAAGSLTTINCTFQNNTLMHTGAWGVAHGGAIYANATARLIHVNTTFRGNAAVSIPYHANGGAIYVDAGGSVVLRRCVFEGNMAKVGGGQNAFAKGGALYMTKGRIDATDTHFRRNTAQYLASTVYRSFNYIPTAQGGAISIEDRCTVRFVGGSFTANLLEAMVEQSDPSYVTSSLLSGAAVSMFNTSALFQSVVFRANRLDDNGVASLGGSLYGGIFRVFSDNNFKGETLLRIQSCSFVSNRVDLVGEGYGGVLFVALRITLSIANSTFDSNYMNVTTGSDSTKSFVRGGVLYHQGSGLTVTSCNFTNNVVYRLHTRGSESVANGGVLCIYDSNTVNTHTVNVIQNSTFLSNSILLVAREQSPRVTTLRLGGGAISYISLAAALISGCAFTRNRLFITGNGTAETGAYGGALHLGSSTSSSVTIQNTIFTSNSANATRTVWGGAAYIYSIGQATLTNVHFVGNSAATFGTGLYVRCTALGSALHLNAIQTRATIQSCSFTQNGAYGRAASGAQGTLYVRSSPAGLELSVRNSTFTSNVAQTSPGIAAVSGTSAKFDVRGCSFLGLTTSQPVIYYQSGGYTFTCTQTSASTHTNEGTAGACTNTQAPTRLPTQSPSQAPTRVPTQTPTVLPTRAPSTPPTLPPTNNPSTAPTRGPTDIPTQAPTQAPSVAPTLNPTLGPTNSPTDIPTQGPTETPTLAPTPSPTLAPSLPPTLMPTPSYVIQVKSPSHSRSGQLLINKEDLTLRVVPSITRADGDAIWRSPNGTQILTAEALLTPSLTTSFLGIRGASLQEGRTYVLVASSSGSYANAKIILKVNAGPSGGTLQVSPLQGQALATTFTTTCLGWTDPELPLSYRYSALFNGGTVVQVAGPTNESTIQSFLPPSQNLTMQLVVKDCLGASTVRTFTDIQVSSLTDTNSALTIIGSLEAQLNSTSGSTMRLDNSSASALVSMLGVVTNALCSMPEPVPSAVETRLLRLVNASLGAVELDLSRAEALGSIINALSTQAAAVASSDELLGTTEHLATEVQAQVRSISPALAGDIVDAVDGLVRYRYALDSAPTYDSVTTDAEQSSECAAVDRRVDCMGSILRAVHDLTAASLVPGQAPVLYAASNLGLTSQAHTLQTMEKDAGVQLASPFPTGLSFNLSSTTLERVLHRNSLDDQAVITIKQVDWKKTRRPCADATSVLAGGHRNSSNDTVVTNAVGQIELLLPDGDLPLRQLSPPLRIASAFEPTTDVQVTCRLGQVEQKTVQCPAYPGTEPQATVIVTCDGTVRVVSARCPAPPPRCAFWNTSSRQWSRAGVTTVGVVDGRVVCESTHATEFAVLHYAVGQIFLLSELMRDPEWLQEDRSIFISVAVMYFILGLSLYFGQKKRVGDDRYFAEAIKARLYYEEAAKCLSTQTEAGLPPEHMGSGEHFYQQKPLRRSLDTVIKEITAVRVAVLQAELGSGIPKRGKVSSELMSMSLGATLGPSWQQRRIWIFLRLLTFLFLCTLLHGQQDKGFITTIMAQGKVTGAMTMAQLSIALQRSLLAFPLQWAFESLTRTMNRKSRDDRMNEADVNYPFYIPAPHEPLSQHAYFCALRLAVLQLEVTRRSLFVDARIQAQKRQGFDAEQITMMANWNKAVKALRARYRRELYQVLRHSGFCGRLTSLLAYYVPFEQLGSLHFLAEFDVEKTIEAEYDSWMTHRLKQQWGLGWLLAWYYRNYVGRADDTQQRSSIGVAWDYILSYAAICLYTVFLTLCVTLLSLNYTPRDATAVFASTLVALCMDVVTTAALSFMLRKSGFAIKRRLINTVSSLQDGALLFISRRRDPATGLRLPSNGSGRDVAGTGTRKIKLDGDTAKVRVVTAKMETAATTAKSEEGIDQTNEAPPAAGAEFMDLRRAAQRTADDEDFLPRRAPRISTSPLPLLGNDLFSRDTDPAPPLPDESDLPGPTHSPKVGSARDRRKSRSPAEFPALDMPTDRRATHKGSISFAPDASNPSQPPATDADEGLYQPGSPPKSLGAQSTRRRSRKSLSSGVALVAPEDVTRDAMQRHGLGRGAVQPLEGDVEELEQEEGERHRTSHRGSPKHRHRTSRTPLDVEPQEGGKGGEEGLDLQVVELEEPSPHTHRRASRARRGVGGRGPEEEEGEGEDNRLEERVLYAQEGQSQDSESLRVRRKSRRSLREAGEGGSNGSARYR